MCSLVFASRFTRRFAGVFASGFTSEITAFVKRRAVSANAVCLYAHSHTVKLNPPESDTKSDGMLASEFRHRLKFKTLCEHLRGEFGEHPKSIINMQLRRVHLI